jgi:AhpC/TSA family
MTNGQNVLTPDFVNCAAKLVLRIRVDRTRILRMKGLATVWVLLLALMPDCHAADQSLPVVDLGWLRAMQIQSGWFVTRANYIAGNNDKITPGDAITAVDGQHIRDCNGLTATVFLRRIGSGAETAEITRNGSTRLLHLAPLQEKLLKLGAPQHISDIAAPIYAKEAPAPSLELNDESGKIHRIQYGPNWTLIHIWSTACAVCYRDISALNEILNPPPTNLTVVVIAIDDTIETLSDFSRREALRFKNLIGGTWIDGPVTKAFDPTEVPTDIIADPTGQVMFVGAGSDSLRSALAYTKQLLLQ